MKPLHEKKLSELELFMTKDGVECPEGDKSYVILGGYCDEQVKRNLKQWAAAIVKNCNCESKYGDKCGTIYGKLPEDYVKSVKWKIKNPFKMIYFCPACQRFIVRFELTEEDLK